jgi:hypothetical protein
MTMILVCPGGWTVSNKGTPVDGEVRMEINGDQGRLIDVSDKKSKWRQLSEVHPDGRTIQARLPRLLWDHPHFRIDLPSGRLWISEAGEFFYGACHPGASGDPL